MRSCRSAQAMFWHLVLQSHPGARHSCRDASCMSRQDIKATLPLERGNGRVSNYSSYMSGLGPDIHAARKAGAMATGCPGDYV